MRAETENFNNKDIIWLEKSIKKGNKGIGWQQQKKPMENVHPLW